MFKFKIYSIDKQVLDKVCTDYNIESDYIYESYWSSRGGRKLAGFGYCSDGKYLRVFCSGSHVDEEKSIEDITSKYVTPEFTL